MKKGILFVLVLAISITAVCSDIRQPGQLNQNVNIKGHQSYSQSEERDTYSFSFSVPPTTLVMSYFDYMIGGYNDLPLNVEPDPAYGGYFLTYHGKRTPTGQRRVFYSYIDNAGIVQNNSELTSVQNFEGFPSCALDPVSGKPLYAWHYGLSEAQDHLDVQFTYDTFFEGIAGIINEPTDIINNPITFSAPYNTTDNEFIWPSMSIGPSPTPNMRRVYVLARNFSGHLPSSTNPSENVWIAYADFNADMLIQSTPLTWNHTTIPTLDNWNHSTGTPNIGRRPSCAFTVGNDGRLYYIGTHTAYFIGSTGDIVEPDLDVFVCDNYGQGNWTRVIGSSEYSSWNPKLNFGAGPGVFFDGSDNTTPIPSDSLFWGLTNSAHMNAVLDDSGKIHSANIWAQQFREGTPDDLKSYFHGAMQTVKDLIYDTNTQSFSFREIYPIAGTASDTLLWRPWDEDGDWLVDEYWDDPEDPDSAGYPKMSTLFPFPYWDDSVHEDGMYFHYSNVKITEPNTQGMMAAVWQDCNKARLYNEYAATYPELAPYVSTPEIWISISQDYGVNWSEPLVINKNDTPGFEGIKPMWVYPANKIIYTGYNQQTQMKEGKLGILFYDDISWGSYNEDPPVGQNDGGYVKFMEINLSGVASEDPVDTPVVSMLKQNYPNPFNPETTISFNMPKNSSAKLSIYNTKGQLIQTLIDGFVSKGNQKVTWRGTDSKGNNVASGVYFYKLDTNGTSETRKMMLMK